MRGLATALPVTRPLCILLAELALSLAATASAEVLPRAAVASPLLDLANQVAEEHHGELGARDGHYAGVVEFPYDALLARIHLIRAARRTIDLQTYIWANDESSRLVAYELVQAARRGVRVRVMLDSLGILNPSNDVTFDETTYPCIEIKVYRPSAKLLNPGSSRRLVSFLLPRGANQRMHSKVMIVDGVLGLTGGRNIGNDYFGLATGYNFKDRDVMVAGPQVSAMTRSFNDYWTFKHTYFNSDMKDVAKLIKRGQTQPELTRETAGLDAMFAAVDKDASDPAIIEQAFVRAMLPVASLEFVADLPGKKTRLAFINIHTRSRVALAFWGALEEAREEVLLQSPYTIFDLRARNLFHRHTKQAPHLRVRVSTNSLAAADHTVTYAANYRLRTTVVKGLKFELYEMKPHPAMQKAHLPRFEELQQRARDEGKSTEPYLSVHAKTYIFDARTVYIGTLNFDPRSFYVNGESGVFIQDEAFAKSVREVLLRDMSAANSWVVAPNRHLLGFVNGPIEAVSAALPIDPWPLHNTSCFELRPGAKEVPPTDPDFYKNYTNVGSFPGTNGLQPRRIMTSILKTFGMATTPLL